MYHISKDSRAQHSAGLICQALKDCLQTQSFSEITVSEIQRRAGISRSTFYRLFDNPADILAYLSDSVLACGAQLMEEQQVHSGRAIMLIYIDLWRKNLPILAMIEQCGRLDLIYESNRTYLLPLRNRLSLPACAYPADSQYFWTIMTSLQAAVLKVLLDEDPWVSSEEIAKKIELCMESFHTFFVYDSQEEREDSSGV